MLHRPIVQHHAPTSATFKAVIFGATAGLALGIASVRYIEAILYRVKATSPEIMLMPAIAINRS